MSLHPISDKAEVSVFSRQDILVELAKSLASRAELDERHRTELNEAAKQLCRSLEPRPNS